MLNDNIRQPGKDFAVIVYFSSTLFMVFFSVHAIHKWPSIWAQWTIILACFLPALVILVKKWPELFHIKKWPVEIKFALIIVVLGMLNICFSEDQSASFKGMGLFLISGILVFCVSYFLFNSKQTQKFFLNLCSFCFIALLVYGVFEIIQQINIPRTRVMLFSSNPIPAGSLLILLSIGPLVLLAEAKNGWHRFLWVLCLLSGALLITIIAQRGPALAMIIMAFILTATKRKGIWIFTLVALVLVGVGYQFRDQIPAKIKTQLLQKETLLVRMEFYYIALDVIKEKPIFGLGFNAPLSRFIPSDYKSKIYPRDEEYPFYNMVAGVNVFDNMALSFLGEAGGLFSIAYIGLAVSLLINITRNEKSNTNDRRQALLLLVVLAGFMAHSMTYDSLKNPHLNWIFHSLLSLLARCRVS